MKTIQRQPVRDHSYRQILESIVRGEFTPGSRIRDTEIAARLGISRTPVRESLLRLTQEGFVDNLPGRGFRVRPMDIGEVEEIYPILWSLETLALETSPPPEPEIIETLRDLGRQIAAANQDPLRRIEIDEQWHMTLISGCPNQRLLKLIGSYKALIRRYLFAYILKLPQIEDSIDDHAVIISLLEKKDLKRAAKRIKPHWRNNLVVLTQALGVQNDSV